MSVFILYKVFEPGPKKGKEQPACLYWCVSVSFPKHLLTVCLTPCSATPSRALLGGLSFSFYKQQGQMAALRILCEQRTLLPISEIDVDGTGREPEVSVGIFTLRFRQKRRKIHGKSSPLRKYDTCVCLPSHPPPFFWAQFYHRVHGPFLAVGETQK